VKDDTLWTLAAHFSLLSLIAFGGAQTVIPEIHRQAVDVARWMTASEFADLFAISQASPGPNMLFVALVGWKAAGLAGALVATLGMCLPSCLLTYAVNRVWHRFRGARWRVAVQFGLAPVTVGIVLSSGYILSRAADDSWVAYAVTAATVIVVLTTRLNPLWMLAAGGLLGIAGVV
jgi:chromate transporter